MTRSMAHSVLVVGLVAVSALAACSKDETSSAPASKAVDAAVVPAAPKNLDLAQAALVSARAKHAAQKAGEADCAPLRSLKADFARDTAPAAVKTAREIDVFCEIDITLEGAVTTLKADHEKLAAAVKKKDRATEEMYTATVREGCASVRKQMESLANDRLDTEPKVVALKAEVDPICSPPAAARKK